MKIILFLATAFLCIGCNESKSEKTKSSSKEEKVWKIDKVTNEVMLSLHPAIFELAALPNTLNIKMINHTTDTITTGLHYRIELFENNQWITVSPQDIAFNDLGYFLQPSDSSDFEIRFFKDRVNYQSGKYRIVKYYLLSDYKKTRETHDVYTEFKIK